MAIAAGEKGPDHRRRVCEEALLCNGQTRGAAIPSRLGEDSLAPGVSEVMNRVSHATRVIAALLLASLWPASGAIAKAHAHRHRSLRPIAAERRRDAARRASRGARRARAHKRRHPARRAVIHTHMAGDPAVSIVDFHFSPATTTIHVGDTITWTNTGKQPHSATADNHSFDTGILHAGQSGSHTFTSAGTFTYFCVVHPFMKGTIVVLATTTTTTTTTSPTTPTATTARTATPSAHTTSTTPTAANSQTLPFTGLNDLAAFAIGLLLVGGGFGLRARVR